MKAFWIARVKVTDPDAYAAYAALGPAAFSRYGGKILARGGRALALEGDPSWPRTVVIEFPSLEQALACYDSPDYREARARRAGAAEVEILIIEGVEEPPQA